MQLFLGQKEFTKKDTIMTQERKYGSHVSHGHCEAFLVLDSPEFLTPRRHKHSLKPQQPGTVMVKDPMCIPFSLH